MKRCVDVEVGQGSAASDISSQMASPPCQGDTVQQSQEREKRKRYQKLLEAANNGQWHIAKLIYDQNPEEINAEITEQKDTALHIAAAKTQTEFGEKLLKYQKQMGQDHQVNLLAQNQSGNTAFYVAAASGATRLVQVMMYMNKDLAMIRGDRNTKLPITIAAISGQRKTVSYLYPLLHAQLDVPDRQQLFITLIHSDIYDIALRMLKECKSLAKARVEPEGDTPLHAFAKKSNIPSKPSFQTTNTLWNLLQNPLEAYQRIEKLRSGRRQARELISRIWEEVTLMSDVEILEYLGSPKRLLIFTAAEKGNYELLQILIRGYPELASKLDTKDKYSIFHYAVLHRNKRIFSLIHEIGSLKDAIIDYKDQCCNNILHLVAKYPPKGQLHGPSTEALKMQFELQWFRDVRSVVQPKHIEEKNCESKSAEEVFVETHKALRGQGEEWMIKRCESYMVVAILSITVTFAATFTVPGGYKAESKDSEPKGPVGMPIFLHSLAFKIFASMAAISVVLSTKSVLAFLSLIMSPYKFGDFVEVIPNKFFIGLSTLVISMAAMLGSFVAAFFIIFNNKLLPFSIIAALYALNPLYFYLSDVGPLLLYLCAISSSKRMKLVTFLIYLLRKMDIDLTEVY